MELNILNPSLADILSMTDPDGNIAPLVSIAEKSLPILQYGEWLECNNGDKHRTFLEDGFPEPSIRRFNQGVKPSKVTGTPHEDTTAMFEDYGEVDARLARLGGKEQAFRARQSAGKARGFRQRIAREFFYGSTKIVPDGFMGMAARFNDPSAPNGRQIIDAGGTGSDNCSVWFLTFGGNGINWIYPKGHPAGFDHKDLGEHTKEFPDGSMMQVLRDNFFWGLGITQTDWRGTARVANIDVSALTADASAGADLIDLLIDAEETLDTAGTVGVDDTKGDLIEGQTIMVVPPVVSKFLRKQALNKANVNLTVGEVGGKRVTMWGEFPVIREDSLLQTETRVA